MKKIKRNIINDNKLNNYKINTFENIPDNIKNNKMNEIQEETEKKYIIQAKEYLKKIKENEDYKKILNNNPEQLFDILDEKKFSCWQSVVFNSVPTIIESDSDILDIKKDRADQQLIEVDVKRTRFLENHLITDFHNKLEAFLTFYCNVKQINYKQGLNEIFAPLILMKYKIKKLKYVNIYNFGESFIDKFFPNYYYEKEAYSIKSSLSIFGLLLKYHEPSVYQLLDSLEINNELYAVNWFLTLRSGKLNLDIFYYFIDNLLKINDPLFIHFILVALIIYYRELLINCDPNLLVKLLTGLTLTSKEQVDELIKISLELRNNTPYSLRFLVNRLGFLKINNKNIVNAFNKYKPEDIKIMPIYPIEILYGNNSKYICCPNPECENNTKNKKFKIDWTDIEIYQSNAIENNRNICEMCEMKVNKKLDYILLDLRIFPPGYFKKEDDYFKLGFISGIMAIDKNELMMDDLDEILSSNLLQVRGRKHIVLMSSKTDYFEEFEKKFYLDKTSDKERKKMLFGVIEMQKSEKILNLTDTHSLNLKEIYKLKEYDNIRKIINSMKNKNFPYISYLEGGFEALHDECLNYKIELIGHEKRRCLICINNNNKKTKENLFLKLINIKIKSEEKVEKDNISNISDSLWKTKTTINSSQIGLLLNNNKNILLYCCLRKYKNKIYKNFKVYVFFIFEKKMIDIYKSELPKEKYIYNPNDVENNTNPNYYNLGIKNDKEKKNLELKLLESVKLKDIKKASFNHQQKTIIIIEIMNKDKINDSKEDVFLIELEFFTVDDSKYLMNAIKNAYKSDKKND